MTKKRNTTKAVTFGQEIIDALEDFHRTLRRSDPIESKYTVHTYEISAPATFKPANIKALRHRLSASQSIFAQLLGVSPVLVEHWERGIRTPHPLACRLLEQIAQDPAAYMKRYMHRKAG
jgi:DNA-binding transcriptional regulator YiaG